MNSKRIQKEWDELKENSNRQLSEIRKTRKDMKEV
jgi:hypothetical protein